MPHTGGYTHCFLFFSSSQFSCLCPVSSLLPTLLGIEYSPPCSLLSLLLAKEGEARRGNPPIAFSPNSKTTHILCFCNQHTHHMTIKTTFLAIFTKILLCKPQKWWTMIDSGDGSRFIVTVKNSGLNWRTFEWIYSPATSPPNPSFLTQLKLTKNGGITITTKHSNTSIPI